MKRTEAIAKFLSRYKFPLCSHYNANMEVQVNVAKGNGEPIQGSYHGRNWHGFTDGLTTWKSFRIPWNARENPYYEDKDITFNISQHAEAIGMTGWDWRNKCSRWVAFDFDSITEHTQGLSNEDLKLIKDRIEHLNYISLYSSTSNTGLHLYVFCMVQNVANHTEHAAVARCILAKISLEIKYNLEAKVDTCGGNIWIWHRDAKGFKTLKSGTSLTHVPDNWKDYLDRVSKYKLVHGQVTDKELLVAAQNELKLDEDHLKLLEWFERDSGLAWYDNEKQMLVCHTADLKRAHEELKLNGVFRTISKGKDHGRDQNCYGFPLPNGGWIIRRHTRGTSEHSIWHTDSSGWTTCYYNRLPSLRTASTTVGGIEGEKEYNFQHLKEAIDTLKLMSIQCEIPDGCHRRPAVVREAGDKLVVSFKSEEGDLVSGWAKKKVKWERIFFTQSRNEIELPDNLIRHVTVAGTDLGWYLLTNHKWVVESKHNATSALIALGYKRNQIELMLGKCIIQNWLQVQLPFQLEYPGKRMWNMNAPQFKFNPKQGKHPTWDLVLNHCGAGLEPEKDKWCYDNGILSGGLYLQFWVAALLQQPSRPLPYLVFYGEQNTGKSIFHESIALLFTGGYIRADHALTNTSGFNGELANAILCVVEETNLSKRGYANDRIKDWVTGLQLSIHAKGRTPVNITNCTHWVQCTNDPSYCPILPGDTRIVLAHVSSLESEIPKTTLLDSLISEGPAFLFTLVEREIPRTSTRLMLPCLDSEIKTRQQALHANLLVEFIDEKCYKVDGCVIRYSIFYDEFINWLDAVEKLYWSKRRLSSEMIKNGIISGRMGGSGDLFVGNVGFVEEEEKTKLVERKGRLVDENS